MKVYIIKGKGDIKKIKHLFSKFSEVEIINHDYVDVILKKHDDSSSVIIVKQSTISMIEPDKLYNMIKDIDSRRHEFDLFYLTTWNDACQKRRIFWEKHNLYYTYEPHGIQAIMVTPRGKRRILGYDNTEKREKLTDKEYDCFDDIVQQEHLVALTCFPHLVTFDPEAATDNKELLYLNQCRTIKNTTDSSTTNAYIWFIIAIIIILVVGYAFFFGRK